MNSTGAIETPFPRSKTMTHSLKHLDAKRWLAAAGLVLGTAISASPAIAALFTYTMDGGDYTGTINGTPFSNATLTITATADSASVVSSSLGPATMYNLLATPTFTITQGANIWTGTLLQTSGYDWGVNSVVNWGLAFPGNGIDHVAGFLAGTPIAGVTCLPGVATSGGSGTDLSTATSLSGSHNLGSTPCTLSTSLGSLVISSYNVAPGTFVIAPAGGGNVPLPATLPLLLGGLGVLAVRRQRLAAQLV